MAAMEDDVFFDELQKHCKIIESALISKCNMNHQVCEDARQALGELKASIYNFKRVKAANFLTCKQRLKEAIASQVTPKQSYASVMALSGVTKNKEKSSYYCVVVDSGNFSSEDVKKIIKAKINPAESKLGVCDMKNIRGNKLLVKRFSEKDESIRQCRVRFTLKTFQHTRHVVIETHPTAAITVRSRHLSTFIDYKNTDYNMVTLEVIAGSTAFTLFSYYFEPSKNIDSAFPKISQVFSSKNPNRLGWSMDSYSKSKLWCSPYSDARGDKLCELISANNLFIINEDCGPTFRATQKTSYIDITVIDSNESLSDLVMIEFELCLSTVLRDTSSAPFVIFNTKKANWCHFWKFCFSRMTHIFDTLNGCTNNSCLNTVIEELSIVIYQALNVY
ncbi:hypothetical protein TNCV_2276261 [Trichonephila clavipes]|nr:hypothetical protein TNCV_2276261 [Trichonephila clavipes]